jgi:rubrerythrin
MYVFSPFQIAEMAVSVESASRVFYLSWAKATDDEAVRAVFTSLADDEAQHKRFFRAMARKYHQAGEEQTYIIDIQRMMQFSLDQLKKNVFKPATVDHALGLKEALDIACEAEEGAVLVYTEIRKSFLEQFHEVLDEIIKTEAGHLKLVKNLKSRLGT